MAVVFTALNTLHAQSTSDSATYKKLIAQGKESGSTLDTVLKSPEIFSSMVLFAAGDVALHEKRLEDACFLLYAGELRLTFDHALYPSAGSGDPMQPYAELQQESGARISPAIMRQPALFAKALERVKSFNPKVIEGYNTGWKYGKKAAAEEAQAAFVDAKKELLHDMGGVCTLLQDETYFAAFKVCQEYNLKSGTGGPSQKAYDANFQIMKRIEKEKGIHGFALEESGQ